MSTTQIIIFRPNAEPETISRDIPEEPGYELLKSIVCPYLGAGTYMERVAVLYDGRPCDMFVDETGHLKGLPRNLLATKIYHTASESRGEDMTDAPVIVGPAVLFCRRVWF